MRLPYLPSLLLVVAILPVTIAEPDVFGDYFDDGMKLVDISQDAALRSCLSDGKTADKTKAAYDGCYGQGYDFDDLAKAGGDDDGLPEELEEKEGCFYKKMGWVSEDNVMEEAAIAADMEGLEKEIQKGFLTDVKTCIAWSGNFGERRKREAGMEVQGETQDRELVPGLMDTGKRAMGWVRQLVRKVRSPGNGDENKKTGKKQNKKPKKKRGKKNNPRRRGNRRSGKKQKGKPNPSKKRRNRRKGKTNNKNNPNKRRGRRGKNKRPNNGQTSRKRNKRRRGGNKVKKGKPNQDGKKPGKRRNKSKKGKPNQDDKKTGKRRNRKKNGGNKGPCRKGQKCKNDRKSKKQKENKKDKKEKKDKIDEPKARKNDRSLPEAVYNKLWCIDLAIEQALEKCVEAKIQN